MMRDAVEQFGAELLDVIERWLDKPADDQLTEYEMVGVIECIKASLIQKHPLPRPRLDQIG